jgi:8-oxo-dGTP pyrophosphatase MutT (NUDIX family)
MKERLQAWGDTKVIPIAGLFAFSEDGELLLLQRHSEDLGGGQWGTPGGRLEDGEDAETAVLREVDEETGIKSIEVKRLGVHKIKMPHGAVNMTSFIATIPRNIPIKIDPVEHHAYAWFKPEGLLDEDNILWGIPSILRDFGLFGDFDTDPTLADGSSVELLEKAFDS